MAPLIKNLLFTVLLPGTVAVYVPYLIAQGRSVARGSTLAFALAVLAVGIGIYAWCVWDFATFGRGTPAPIDPPKKLVVRGLYRYTRNPMYVGVLTVVLGWATLFQDVNLLLYLLLIGTLFHLFILGYEEPHLLRKFESQYEAYRSSVSRWLPMPRRGRDAQGPSDGPSP